MLSFDFLKIFLPLVSAIVAWFANEWRKRIWEEYQRKEEKYKSLLKSLEGFYTFVDSSEAKKLKQTFLNHLNLCWLYCPDSVIEKAYEFLSCVHTDVKCADDQKEKALGELVFAIRKDLLSRRIVKKTSLKPNDFKIYKPT
ncbi:MAG: hypothetical protein J7L46_03310 [Bacteroidales bacterium]|nr:hypothetical protein [Bacteroidales bacterium]